MLEREISWRTAFGIWFLALVAGLCLVVRSFPGIWDTLLIAVLVAPAMVPQRRLWLGLAVSGALMTFIAIYTLLTLSKIMHEGLIVAAIVYDLAAIIAFRQARQRTTVS
jgi:hypothetical protein